MKKLIVVLFLLLILLPNPSLAYYPVRTVVLKFPSTNFTVKPFSTLIIPFTLINEGRTNLTDVVISVQAPLKYFNNPLITVSGPIPPKGAYNDTLRISVGPAPPGNYTVFITVDSEKGRVSVPIIVTVKKTVSLKLYIFGAGKYKYWSKVPIVFSVLSLSNVNLSCNATITVHFNNSLYAVRYYSFNLSPGKRWTKTLLFKRPPVGKYIINLTVETEYGNFTATSFFIVERRHLNLTAEFKNGELVVRVEENGYGVGGVRVWINGKDYTTAPDGSITLIVEKPGFYRIIADLDGTNVTRIIRVREIHFIAVQKGDLLLVKALDDSNTPIPNLPVIASVLGNISEARTNQSGVAVFNISVLGHGKITITTNSPLFLVKQATFYAKTPVRQRTKTTSITLSTPSPQTTKTAVIPKKLGSSNSISWGVYVVLLLFPISIVMAFYLVGMRPIVSTEVLGKYYFIKVKGPKYKRLKNFRITRKVIGTEASATKGKVELKDGKVVWIINELNPEEEAYLKVRLE